MSEGLLRALEGESDDASLQVSGHPWTGSGEFKGMPLTALTANILCQYHNSCLHRLDDEGARLYRFLREITRPDVDAPNIVLFSGHDIERWMFKTLCGYLFGGIAVCEDGTRVDERWFSDDQLALIAESPKWNNNPFRGLYYLARTGHTRSHEPKVKFGPIP